MSGYEGSELLVARLLIESGADVPYVGTACPRTEWSDADREWLEAHGRARPVPRLARAGHRGDARRPSPDLAIGTTPVVQKAKELGIPALYFTNMVSARPLFGAGRRRLAGRRSSTPQIARASDALRRGWSSSSRASARATPPAYGWTGVPADHSARQGAQPARLACGVDLANAVGV